MGCTLLWTPVFAIGTYLAVKYVSGLLLQRKLNRWSASKTPRDVVILHGFTRGKTLPNNSPFVLKLEVFLRMANIPYKFDGQDAFGPTGKTPWISLNGEHFSDSEMIIQLLQKKFQPKLHQAYSDAELAAAKAFRIVLEDHCFWGLIWDRFIWHGPEFMDISSDSWAYVSVYRRIAILLIKFQTYHHGIGRHAEADILRLTCDDLRAVSAFLGDKKFILGDEPCVEDCGIFGQVAQAVWALPNSEYEKLSHGELANLKSYCVRMKERFYKDDWGACLA